MTVVTRHVGSVWTEASVVGRRGVPKMPDGRDGRDERDGRDGRDERDPHMRVGHVFGGGGGGAGAGVNSLGPEDIITVIVGKNAAALDV